MVTEIRRESREVMKGAEQLLALRGELREIVAAPGWESFFIDLWNKIEGPGLMRLRRTSSGEGFPLSREETREMLRRASTEEGRDERGEIRLKEGMLCLMKRGVAHVIAVEEELSFPEENRLDVVVTVLQWAAWQGASSERMRNGLAACCLGPGRGESVGVLGSVRFLDGHAFRTEEEVARALRWIETPVIALTNGVSGLQLRCFSSGETAEGGERFYAVGSIREGVNRVLEFSETERLAVLFPGVGLSSEEAGREAEKWNREVNRR